MKKFASILAMFAVAALFAGCNGNKPAKKDGDSHKVMKDDKKGAKKTHEKKHHEEKKHADKKHVEKKHNEEKHHEKMHADKKMHNEKKVHEKKPAHKPVKKQSEYGKIKKDADSVMADM